jgi:Protein of unknown function (DUF4229)
VQFLKYTFWRAVIFAVAWAVLWLWWGDAFLSAIVALLISGIASYFLLRRQRDALADQIQARAGRAVKNSQANEDEAEARRAETLTQLDEGEFPAAEYPVDHGDEQQR